MRILHISDLHYLGPNISTQPALIERFLVDAEGMRPYDLVVFSGDLTAAGKPDQYAAVFTSFIEPLFNRCGVSSANVLLVPGNHDVDRDAIDEYRHSGLQTRLTDETEVERLIADDEKLLRVLEPMGNWNSFFDGNFSHESMVRHSPLLVTHTSQIDGLKVGVAMVNSAWRSLGRGDDFDKGELLVGERTMRDAAALLSDCELRILTMHHPLEWLKEFDANVVRRYAERDFDLILTGHTHTPDPKAVISTRGMAVFSACGALYQGNEYRAGYTVLDIIDPLDQVTAIMRTYFPDPRNEYDSAVDVCKGGAQILPLKQFRQGSDLRSYSTISLTDYSEVQKALVEILGEDSLISDRIESLGLTSLDDLLVAPRFRTFPIDGTPFASTASEGLIPEQQDPLAALHIGEVPLIVGAPESGLTGSLLWILQRSFESDAGRFPVYLRLGDVGAGHDAVVIAIRQSMARLGFPLETVRNELPPLIIAVDNVDDVDGKAAQRLLTYMSAHSEHRFVLGTHDVSHRVSGRLSEKGVNIRAVFLGDFRRQELRSIVANIASDSPPNLVDRVLNVIVAEQLPRTPFMMSILVIVMSATPTIQENLNLTGAVKLYVDQMLRSCGLEDPRWQLDLRNWEHILGVFAASLVRKDASQLSRLDADALLNEYFRNRSWSGSPARVIDTLIARKLLKQSEYGIEFRHSSLKNYFAALRANEDHEFMDLLLDSPLRHASVLAHASGLNRADRRLLERVAVAVREVIAPLVTDNDVEIFDHLADSPGWSDAAGYERLAERVRVEPISPEERETEQDEVWELMETSGVDLDPRALAAWEDFKISSAQRICEAAGLLSIVLRNSELLEDNALKVKLVKEAIDHWSKFAVAMIFEDDKLHLMEKTFDSIVKDLPDAAKIRPMFLSIKKLIFVGLVHQAIKSTLGTRKLLNPLFEVIEDEDFMEQIPHSFFAVILYISLGGPKSSEALDTLLKRHRDNRMILEIAQSVVLHNYHNSEDPGFGTERLENSLADIIIQLEGVPGDGRKGVAKSRIVQQLRDDRSRRKRPELETGD